MTMTKHEIRVHPAAQIIPLMDEKTYREFVEDINKNGLQKPIELLPDGTLIDGRHRLRACRELEVEPDFITVNPESPVAHVLSANKHRRHLTSSQRAALAAEEMPRFKAEAKERQRLSRGAGVKGPKKSPDLSSGSDGDARARAAQAFGTNEQYVSSAETIRKNAPELFEKLKSGDLTLRQAQKECGRKTGVRSEIRANAAHQRAAEWLARVEGIVGFCEKVSVEAIRKDARLLRHWREASKSARRALADLLRRLEEK